MIYILFPTKLEMGPLAGLIGQPSITEIGRKAGVTGTIAGRRVTALVSGIGQANTAQAVTAVLEGGDASLLILSGCAGGFPGGGLVVGDVAVATEEVYADLGVMTPKGWSSMEEVGLPLMEKAGVSHFNRFPLNRGLAEKALAGFNPLSFRVYSGPFLTVSTVSGTRTRGDELYGRYKALCENMEGAAAAHVAAIYGAPFLEVRGISNMVEDRNREGWDIKTASSNCANVIAAAVKNLGEETWT